MLPRLDGFTVLRRLRAEGNTTPVLMLTARIELSDRVKGLDAGGGLLPDQALRAPGAAGLRPGPDPGRQPELRQTDSPEYGDLRLDKTSFTLSCGDKSVRLSRKEYDMMELLMLNGTWWHQGDPAAEGVGLRIRCGGQQRGGLYLLPPQEAGAPPLPGEDPHHPMVGYCLEAPEPPER